MTKAVLRPPVVPNAENEIWPLVPRLHGGEDLLRDDALGDALRLHLHDVVPALDRHRVVHQHALQVVQQLLGLAG